MRYETAHAIATAEAMFNKLADPALIREAIGEMEDADLLRLVALGQRNDFMTLGTVVYSVIESYRPIGEANEIDRRTGQIMDDAEADERNRRAASAWG